MVNNLEFTRIDDRLIHGQVVTSWLKRYDKAQHVLVVDDKTAADPFMGNMFKFLIPSGITIEVCSVADTLAKYKDGLPKPTMIIAKGPQTIKALVDGGMAIDFFNIGGMGMTGDRKSFYKNISMNEEEKAICKELIGRGVKIEIQIIPAQGAVDVGTLLK